MAHCGKKYFDSKKRAKSKKKKLEQLYGVKYDIYNCSECGGFHLSTKKLAEDKIYFRTKI